MWEGGVYIMVVVNEAGSSKPTPIKNADGSGALFVESLPLRPLGAGLILNPADVEPAKDGKTQGSHEHIHNKRPIRGKGTTEK